MRRQCAPDFAPDLRIENKQQEISPPETGSTNQVAANEENIPL
jgi:hypothetical protein